MLKTTGAGDRHGFDEQDAATVSRPGQSHDNTGRPLMCKDLVGK